MAPLHLKAQRQSVVLVLNLSIYLYGCFRSPLGSYSYFNFPVTVATQLHQHQYLIGLLCRVCCTFSYIMRCCSKRLKTRKAFLKDCSGKWPVLRGKVPFLRYRKNACIPLARGKQPGSERRCKQIQNYKKANPYTSMYEQSIVQHMMQRSEIIFQEKPKSI